MKSFLRWTCLALAALLVLAVLTDRNVAYASFHFVAAVGALAAYFAQKGRWAGAFLGFFGVLDLYQALASAFHWFPEALFQWSPTDDVVHLILGAGLLALGVLGQGLFQRRA